MVDRSIVRALSSSDFLFWPRGGAIGEISIF